MLQYAYQPMDYDATYATVRGALLDGVFGPPKAGVYSPSVQYTLYQMAQLALERAPQVRGRGVGRVTAGWVEAGAALVC
jgi:urate oxidase